MPLLLMGTIKIDGGVKKRVFWNLPGLNGAETWIWKVKPINTFGMRRVIITALSPRFRVALYEALDFTFGRRLQVRRPRQLLVQLLRSQPPLGPGRYCLALAHPRFILPPLILTRPLDPAISPCAWCEVSRAEIQSCSRLHTHTSIAGKREQRSWIVTRLRRRVFAINSQPFQ